MKYLIDTNVISGLRKNNSSISVRNWFNGVAEYSIVLSCITIGEIRRGIESKRKTDLQSARILDEWLKKILLNFQNRILPIDENVADQWGYFLALDSTNSIDALIAAQAKAYNAILVTRNIKHVSMFPISTLNPFED